MPEHKVQKRKKIKDYVNTFKYLYSYLFVEIHYKLFYITNIKGLCNGW